MKIKAVDEYNENGHLMYAENFIGAYVRGATREDALKKFPDEIARYSCWRELPLTDAAVDVEVVQEKRSSLQICDADSDVLWTSETLPLTEKEYRQLQELALKSAADFLKLYASVPKKDAALRMPRPTFYGAVPATAREMYEHTKNVNSYYFGEIGVTAPDEPDIYRCRQLGFEEAEKRPGFLCNSVFEGSGGELWSLRKVCRRFIWHDCIHAKALYRRAVNLFGEGCIENPFRFV